MFSDVVEDIIDKVKDVVEAEIQESPPMLEGSADGALEETLEGRAETTTRSDNPWDYIDRKEIDSSNRGGGLYLVYQVGTTCRVTQKECPTFSVSCGISLQMKTTF